MKHFAAEIKICFSKEELEEIARETGFVKRKGKIRYFPIPPKRGNKQIISQVIHETEPVP